MTVPDEISTKCEGLEAMLYTASQYSSLVDYPLKLVKDNIEKYKAEK